LFIPPVFLLASPAKEKEDLIGILENVAKLLWELERQAEPVVREAQYSTREWVCRIGLGWYVYEVKRDEVWAENSVRSADREVDMSVGAACLVHRSHGTLVI